MVNELKRVLLEFSKHGLVFLINEFLLFQYSQGICFVSTRLMALKFAQNNHVPTFFLTLIKLAVKSTPGNKCMNIQTIENS